MASKAQASTALLLLFNLAFFTMVSSNNTPCPPIPPSTPTAPPTPPCLCPPKPPINPSPPPSCPIDTLRFGVCANLLNDLLHLVIGTPSQSPCCTLIQGLVDLEAAVCLCTAIRAQVLGIVLDIPLSLSLLLNYCGNSVPSGFQCA